MKDFVAPFPSAVRRQRARIELAMRALEQLLEEFVMQHLLRVCEGGTRIRWDESGDEECRCEKT